MGKKWWCFGNIYAFLQYPVELWLFLQQVYLNFFLIVAMARYYPRDKNGTQKLHNSFLESAGKLWTRDRNFLIQAAIVLNLNFLLCRMPNTHFLEFGSYVFLEIACNDSLRKCLTSSRGKNLEKKHWDQSQNRIRS